MNESLKKDVGVVPCTSCGIELDARKDALLQEERAHPSTWWYISFCHDHFLGATIVLALGALPCSVLIS